MLPAVEMSDADQKGQRAKNLNNTIIRILTAQITSNGLDSIIMLLKESNYQLDCVHVGTLLNCISKITCRKLLPDIQSKLQTICKLAIEIGLKLNRFEPQPLANILNALPKLPIAVIDYKDFVMTLFKKAKTLNFKSKERAMILNALPKLKVDINEHTDLILIILTNAEIDMFNQQDVANILNALPKLPIDLTKQIEFIRRLLEHAFRLDISAFKLQHLGNILNALPKLPIDLSSHLNLIKKLLETAIVHRKTVSRFIDKQAAQFWIFATAVAREIIPTSPEIIALAGKLLSLIGEFKNKITTSNTEKKAAHLINHAYSRNGFGVEKGIEIGAYSLDVVITNLHVRSKSPPRVNVEYDGPRHVYISVSQDGHTRIILPSYSDIPLKKLMQMYGAKSFHLLPEFKLRDKIIASYFYMICRVTSSELEKSMGEGRDPAENYLLGRTRPYFDAPYNYLIGPSLSASTTELVTDCDEFIVPRRNIFSVKSEATEASEPLSRIRQFQLANYNRTYERYHAEFEELLTSALDNPVFTTWFRNKFGFGKRGKLNVLQPIIDLHNQGKYLEANDEFEGLLARTKKQLQHMQPRAPKQQPIAQPNLPSLRREKSKKPVIATNDYSFWNFMTSCCCRRTYVPPSTATILAPGKKTN